jgi:hypothetical protein
LGGIVYHHVCKSAVLLENTSAEMVLRYDSGTSWLCSVAESEVLEQSNL